MGRRGCTSSADAQSHRVCLSYLVSCCFVRIAIMKSAYGRTR
jgi:hypothetical protein